MIKTLLHHGGRETMTGALLRSSMEYLHLEVGIGSPFFQDNYEVWSDLATDCWLKHVWQFQQDQSLRVDHTVPVVMKQTVHDAFLMPLFVKHGYLANDLRLLNQCRCFLQVLTVADVLVADGSKFCEDAVQGVRNDSRRLAYNWPRTARPANRHWVRWRQALKTYWRYPLTARQHGLWENGIHPLSLNGIGVTTRAEKSCSIEKELYGYSG